MVKRVEGNLSSVLEGYPRSVCMTGFFFHTDIIPPSSTAKLLDAVFKGAL